MLQLNLLPFQILNTERLVLNQLTLSDRIELFFLRSDPGVLKYLGKDPAKNLDEIAQHIAKLDQMLEENTGINYAIRIKDTAKLIGCCGLWKFDLVNHRATIGYVLHPDHHGKGIMSEAIRHITSNAFDVFKFHSIEANINKNNDKSAATLERNGFVKEGHLKESYFYNGVYTDTVIYSKINPGS